MSDHGLPINEMRTQDLKLHKHVLERQSKEWSDLYGRLLFSQERATTHVVAAEILSMLAQARKAQNKTRVELRAVSSIPQGREENK